MIDNMFSNVNWLEKGMDASWLKNQVISNNIANAETPGFKSSSVDFEDRFRAALNEGSFDAKTTRDKHREFSDGEISMETLVSTDTSTSMTPDGNNVDLDYENAELARNTIYYSTLTEQISGEFRRLNIAINGD